MTNGLLKQTLHDAYNAGLSPYNRKCYVEMGNGNEGYYADGYEKNRMNLFMYLIREQSVVQWLSK